MTCFQCIHSQGISWTRSDLYCKFWMRRCEGVCEKFAGEKFQREPGTDEPEQETTK